MVEDKKSEKNNSRIHQFLSKVSQKSEREKEWGITEYFRKQKIKTYKELFKDIEISKNQFITLFLILLCFGSLLLLNILLTVELGHAVWRTQFGVFIVLGIISGLILGGFMLDRIRGKRYPILLLLITLSMILTALHVAFFRRTGEILPGIFLLGTSVFSGVIFIFFLTFFVDFTTILERGRVFSYLIIGIAFAVILIYVIMAVGFFFFPVVIFFLSLLYFYKNRENEEPYKPIERDQSGKMINLDTIQYMIVLGCFGLILGLMIPTTQLTILVTSGWSNFQIIVVVLLAVIFSVVTAVAVGSIFDFFGRKVSISTLLLGTAVVNFIRLFDINIQFFDISIILALAIASFMVVPLFMSDVAQRKSLGKILGITFTIMLIGIGMGMVLGGVVPNIFSNKYTSEIFVIGLVNFLSIVSLFIIVNTKTTMSSKEKNWPDYLIHLYAITDSGMLLYDHSFIGKTLDELEADLASGGFLGLITMLQEITREHQRLRTIDHGGKKLMFMFSQSIIYVLIMTEDLLILRNKLSYFIDEVEKDNSVDIENMTGVDVNMWKSRFDPIIEKIFTRKYFELIPEFMTQDLEKKK